MLAIGFMVAGSAVRSYEMRGPVTALMMGWIWMTSPTLGRGKLSYGDPRPSGGGVDGPGVDGSDDVENAGEGVPGNMSSKWTRLADIVFVMAC